MVEPMSPRLASAITISSASRAAAKHLLERGTARGAVPLEERDLRLDDPDAAGRGIHHAQPELARALDRSPPAPTSPADRVRVDAHAQRPVGGRAASRPVAERGSRSPGAPPRASSAYSCRLLTSYPAPHGVHRAARQPRATAIVVNSALSARDRRRADLVAVGARGATARACSRRYRPRRALMRSTMSARPTRCVVAVLVDAPRARCRCGAGSRPFPRSRRARSRAPAGACTGRTIERLSLSATEMNDGARSGMPPYAASWLFANARREVAVDAHDLTGRAHLRAEHGVDHRCPPWCGTA